MLTTSEAGNAELAIPDDQVLAFAIEKSRAVISLNRKHFILLHLQHPSHSGIIVCTFDADFTSQAKRIDDAIAQMKSLSGQLIRINRPQK